MNEATEFRIPIESDYTPSEGLTSEKAAELLHSGAGNCNSSQDNLSIRGILRSNICTFLNLINVILAVLLFSAGSYRNMLFMGAVLCNTAIGILQQLRARSALKQLRLLNRSKVTVRRDSEDSTLPAEECVLGDLVVLNTGDQVPGDGFLREGQISVNESLLTGESDDCEKNIGDRVFSGSYVTAGKAVIQLVRVGTESYANQLTAKAKVLSRPKSYLMTEMGKLIKIITVLMIPLGVLLFCRQRFISGKTFAVAMPSAVGAMVGMIPNGLAILVSAALVVGVIKLSRKKVLVQELYGIEALACADVLCVDKTGTLTSGKMQVVSLIPQSKFSDEDFKRHIGRFFWELSESAT